VLAVAEDMNLLLVGRSVTFYFGGTPRSTLSRFFKGLAAGLGLCVIPPFLSEISPPGRQGAVGKPVLRGRRPTETQTLRTGILNQFGLVTGILATQIIGFFLSAPGSWRGVFLVTLGVSVLQLFMGLYMIESPAWLTSNSRHNEAKAVASRIWHAKSGGASSCCSFIIGDSLLNGID
jgi:SP family facilitated glucose transporter-like MFS transporter 3